MTASGAHTENRALVDALRAALAERADPVRAIGVQAYMKSTMPYHGVSMPVLREVVRAVFPRFRLSSFDEWRATVLSLWDEARFREERYVALSLLGDRPYQAFRTMTVLPLYEYLIVSGAWWDLVDDVATHRVGDLFMRNRESMRPILLGWSVAEDHWLRRTSIICQVGAQRLTDEELLFACIEPSLGERDFFLRKAIGWALREYSKTAPDRVRRFVVANETRLSPLSRREAVRRLPA